MSLAKAGGPCQYVPFLAQWSLIDRSKKLPAFFYESALGNRPVREWIPGPTLEDRKLVGRDIQKVEFGWPLGMPYCHSLGDGLWEVRIGLTDGRIGRVIFCVAREPMVLLHGFVKKTQKTPAQDLKLALKRMKEVLR
jgi:phage-related protein